MNNFSEIDLREYVRKYIPDGWKETIETVAFVPYWTKEQYNLIKNGVYPEKMVWYLKAAVESFFATQLKQ